jgi:sporulation protein YlmC with PRC-barrel domain
MPGSQLFGVQADLSYMLWGGGAISPDVYIRSGTKDIRAIAENIGTFPERDMICYAEIWEFLTNCTNGTLVYEDNITGIDIEEPLGGTETLTFDDFNFHSEGVYGLFLNLTDDDDDNIANNYMEWGVGVDETPPSSDHTINPPDPDGENGYYVNDVEITLHAADPDLDGGCAAGSGVQQIDYRINGGSWQTIIIPDDEGEGTFVFGDDGNDILIEYRAIDNVGNQEAINSFEISMDQTTPVMEEISWEAYKESGFWYVDLTCSATDATAGMDRVEFYINNGEQEVIPGSGPDYVFTIQWSEEFRKHSFFFYYYDRAGNMIDQYFDPDNITAVPHAQTQQLTSITTQL